MEPVPSGGKIHLEGQNQLLAIREGSPENTSPAGGHCHFSVDVSSLKGSGLGLTVTCTTGKGWKGDKDPEISPCGYIHRESKQTRRVDGQTRILQLLDSGVRTASGFKPAPRSTVVTYIAFPATSRSAPNLYPCIYTESCISVNTAALQENPQCPPARQEGTCSQVRGQTGTSVKHRPHARVKAGSRTRGSQRTRSSGNNLGSSGNILLF